MTDTVILKKGAKVKYACRMRCVPHNLTFGKTYEVLEDVQPEKMHENIGWRASPFVAILDDKGDRTTWKLNRFDKAK